MCAAKKRVFTAAGLGIFLALGACVSEPEDPDLPPKPEGWKLGEATENGELTYRMMCQTCHGENGDGKGPSAATLAGSITATEAALRAPIENPQTSARSTLSASSTATMSDTIRWSTYSLASWGLSLSP